MKAIKIVHITSKLGLTGIMLMSVAMYLTQTEMVRGFFENLEFPTYLVYPLAAAKIIGLIAIWFIKNSSVKEWAYAGFFFNSLLALTAHVAENDGGYFHALLALIFTLTAYIFWKLMNKSMFK
jgi:hypothetical protein